MLSMHAWGLGRVRRPPGGPAGHAGRVAAPARAPEAPPIPASRRPPGGQALSSCCQRHHYLPGKQLCLRVAVRPPAAV